MKYEQYLEWQRATGERIAKAMEKFSIKEGRNSQVFGQSVGVEIPHSVEQEESADTWEYVVYGSVLTTRTEVDPPNEAKTTFGPALAGYAPRQGGGNEYQWVNDAVFVSNTQVFTNDLRSRTAKVTYNITTTSDTQREEFESKGIYRGGLKLICEFYEQSNEEETFGEITPIREYNLFVGRNGDSVTLSAPEPDKFYFLRIVRAERL
jgi:hypothetical protein